MSPLRFPQWSAGCLSACAATLALSAHAQMDTFGGDPGTNALIRIPADTDDWTRHFRLGAMAGLNIKAGFSMSGNSFRVTGDNPAAGTFDNGYVHPDQSGDTVYTSNWGYNNPNQYLSSGGILRMQSTSSFSTTGESTVDGGVMPGLDLAYGGNLWYWKHARVGWEMGVGWLPIDIKDTSPLAASATVDTFNFITSGVTIPTAPYQGTSSGVGPLIPLTGIPGTPTTTNAVVTGTHEMDVSLFTLRLGPSIYWDLSQKFSLSLGAGPAVGLVEGEYKYNEEVTADGVSAVNTGKVSGTDVVFGGYVNTALMYHLQKNGDIYLGAQYMPMTDATISGGGREGRLELSGQVYISLGINWAF